MTKDEALKLALEALKTFHYAMIDAGVLDRQEVLNQGFTAATAIKEALAQPEQEPVACPFPCGWKRLFEIIVADGAFLARSLEEGEAITEHQREVVMHVIGYAKDMALHGMEATPPQRKPLTDEQIEKMIAGNLETWNSKSAMASFVRAIEAAHGIKSAVK